MGQVPLDEGIRVDPDAHRLQQHHCADALAAVHPAVCLVNVGSQNDFFHQISSKSMVCSVKNRVFVL